MRRVAAISLMLVSGLMAGATLARADAIVRTQAMLANTIAEFYIGDERVVVELEIGLEDIAGFRNLLPDELYEKLLRVATRKTTEADVKLDDRGRAVEEEPLDLGDNVLIVE